LQTELSREGQTETENVSLHDYSHPIPQLYYVGHSMGTTTFLAMNSLDPAWGDRVELAVLLAPVAFVDHMWSPLRVLTLAVFFLFSNFFSAGSPSMMSLICHS
jgi:pimeloyl-ACP methyl ester carboxylesterase